MNKHYIHPILKLALLICLASLPVFVEGQITIKEFTGINARRNNSIERMKVVGIVREYHEWVLDEGYPGLNGIFELASPGYPNNLYKWNPSYQTQSQGLRFDDFYQDIVDAGIIVQPVLMQSAPYIINPNLLPSFPDASNQLDQKPLFAGEDPELAESYIEHADWMYHFAARYGNSVFSPARTNQIIAPKLAGNETVVTGLGSVNYIENWNETNKWWLLQTYPSAYFTSEEYAAMTSADYDGHMQTLSLMADPDDPNSQISTVGVKNADSTMQFVLSGISDVDLDYLKDMVTWWETNRTAGTTHGQYPFDIINFHHYSNINQNLHGLGVGGISPEEDDLKEELAPLVAYRDQYFPDKEIWLSEFGYDTDSVSEMRVPYFGIGSYDREEVQAQWIVRSYLEIAAAGFDRAMLFELKDVCSGSFCGLYQSSGLLHSEAKGQQPKKSWYYVGTFKNTLADMSFAADLSPCQDTVCSVDCPRVYRFDNPTNSNEWTYVLWSPTSCDKPAYNFELDLEGANEAYLVEMQPGSTTGVTTYLSGDSITVSISERPVFVVVGKALDTSAIACVNDLTLENVTCNAARVSWEYPAGGEKMQIWRMDGDVDLSQTPFDIFNATLIADNISSTVSEYYFTGLAPDSTYTLVVLTENIDGRLSEPCSLVFSTNSNNCKITIDTSWIFASTNLNDPPVELFDEQTLDPICGTSTFPVSNWGIDLNSTVPVSVSIDLQQQYYIDAIYYFDGPNIGDLTIEYAASPNGPWEILSQEYTVPFGVWTTLTNLISSNTPVRFLRITGDGQDLAIIGEMIICGNDSGLGGGNIPPGPVTNLQTMFPSCNSMTIGWDAPLDNDIDYYEISYLGGQVDTILAGGSTMTHTFYGLSNETVYDFLVTVVDTDGLYSTVKSIVASTLPISDCEDDCGNSCDCQICLKESWIYDLTNVGSIQPSNLVDEQNGLNVSCGNVQNAPVTEWGENYDPNSNVPPASAILDLQQCYIIQKISFFDGNGTGTGKVEYQDENGNWNLIENFTTDLTNEWHELTVTSFQTRYLRFTKNENQAKINEIAVCGFPLNCETCHPSGNDSDADGIADACDICPGFNDFEDGDLDGIPNGCDTFCPNTGQPCDDGDQCTENEIVDNDCNCIGTFADDDGDGVCNANDACPGFDDNIDNNGNGIPDGCESDCNYLTINSIKIDATCYGASDGSIELEVACNSAGGGGSNLALNKTATQSSTSAAPASKAVDGNTGGNFWLDNSTSATGWESQPWWEVDLGSVNPISAVEIWNRTDCCSSYLNDYYVLVSETPFSSNDLNTLLATPGVQAFYQNTPAATPSLINIDENGRHVRVQLTGANLLYLAEVRVLGQSAAACDFNYAWTNGIGDIPNPIGLQAGIYGVTVTNDIDGCSANTSMDILEPVELICSIAETQPISTYGNNDGELTANNSGGTPPYSFLWSDGQTSSQATNLVAGNYTVTTTDVNGCTSENSYILVNPSANCTEGEPCNDNDDCTINDAFDANCNCIGSFTDDDSDGVCNAEDICPGFDDNLDNDGDGIPNDCDPCNGNLAGTPCDDLDDCTENDVFDADCNCSGIYLDDDGDGFCNNDDVCEGFDDNLDEDGDGTPDGCDPDSQCAGFSVQLEVVDESCFNASDGSITLTPPCTSSGGGGGSGINLALNRPATQSSTNWGAAAARAVDGNTDGNFWGASSVTGTAWESNAWWELDLEEVKSISEIEVWNRTDCCSSFLNNYYVLISETPFVSGNLNEVLAQSGVVSILQNEQAGSPSTIPANTTGQYIRIQLVGASFLSLAEVVVKEGGLPDPTCQLEYAWSNGATTQNLDNLTADNYTVTVINMADNCVATSNATIQASTELTGDVLILQEISGANSNDGSLEILSAGGVGNHSIQWSNGQTDAVLTNLPPGNYTVTVTDENGCTVSGSAFLEEPGTSNTDYCGSTGQAPWVEYIQRVQFAGIDNESFKESYGDFTNLTASVQAGNSYSVELTPAFSWLPFDEHWGVWIDFDQDGSFNDPEEQVIAQNSTSAITASIDIPPNALSGSTRMRIAMKRDDAPNHCETFQLGEVEDYSVFISGTGNQLALQDRIEFEAMQMGRQVNLVWMTNMDDLTKDYIVEHSMDGEHFESVGEYLPRTNSGGNELYDMVHSPNVPGIQYYRLRQIKKIGEDYLSPIRSIDFLIDLDAFSVFPNPASRLLFINGKPFNNNSGIVQLSSVTGKILMQKNYEKIPDEPFALDVRNLKDGLYFILVKADGYKQQVARVVICK